MPISYLCIDTASGIRTYQHAANLSGTPFSFSEDDNKFFVIGCNTVAYVIQDDSVSYLSSPSFIFQFLSAPSSSLGHAASYVDQCSTETETADHLNLCRALGVASQDAYQKRGSTTAHALDMGAVEWISGGICHLTRCSSKKATTPQRN